MTNAFQQAPLSFARKAGLEHLDIRQLHSNGDRYCTLVRPTFRAERDPSTGAGEYKFASGVDVVYQGLNSATDNGS